MSDRTLSRQLSVETSKLTGGLAPAAACEHGDGQAVMHLDTPATDRMVRLGWKDLTSAVSKSHFYN